MRSAFPALTIAVLLGALYLALSFVQMHTSSQDTAQSLLRYQAAEIARLKRKLDSLQQQQQQQQQGDRTAAAALVRPTPPSPASIASAGPSENFLLATRLPRDAPAVSPAEAAQVLRSLFSIASLLNRTLVLPPSHPAFDAAELARLGVRTHSASELSAPALAALPEALRCSHVRLESPAGLDSEQLAHALRHYASTRILEFDRPHESYCGPSPRASAALVTTEASLDRLMHAHGEKLLAQCSRSLREEEISQYWDMGKCKGHRVSVALPPEISRLPRGSDLLVTFSTGSVATMAHNWVAALAKAGVREGVIIGALDQKMQDECTKRSLPCVPVIGDQSTTRDLKKCKSGNIRSCPSQYPKMSILKVGPPAAPVPIPDSNPAAIPDSNTVPSSVGHTTPLPHPLVQVGFYRELLSSGFNVLACDADAIFMADPRPFLRTHPWTLADMAVATDCIDVPGDAQRALLHCDFNTGLVYMRGNEAVLNFTEAWREKVANAKEERIRDQAAFNMITKATPGLATYRDSDGKEVPRVYVACRGSGGGTPLLLGVLPLNRFLNGHTFFVQHVHTLPQAEPPISVHMTYQFAEGAAFAYGKRQRLREAGLWFVDDADYFGGGKYLAVSTKGATLPPVSFSPTADSRDAIKQHLAEHAHRLAVLRSLLGIAKALGRRLVLPRMLCYCDYMWKEMRACRVGGAESMRLPFDCPMDHVLDTPLFFENNLGVEVREPGFLSDPRVPSSVSGSVAQASMPAGTALNDVQVRTALARFADAAVLVLDEADGRFCGFADAAAHAAFAAESERVLTYERVPFCTMEGSDNAPLYSRCCMPWHEGEKFFPCQYGFGKPKALPACAAGA